MTFLTALQRFKFQFGGVLLLLAVVYWRIIPPMVQQWYQDENYSHGFIVPLIAGYFLYTRWDELKQTLIKPWNAGLAVIVFGLCQLVVAWLGAENFTMRSSLIVLLAGLTLYFFGVQVFRVVLLPIAYLIFMVPIPYIIYDALAFPLKLFVTKVSVGFLKLVGVVVMREGNIIIFPTTTLEVADACSGIRSLISLLALAVAFAFFLRIVPWKRWFLIFSAIPIAILTNALRVIITGFLAQFWGAKAAEGFFHEFAGMAVFALAMIMLVSIGALLMRGSGDVEKRGSEKAKKRRSGEAGKRGSEEEGKRGSEVTASSHNRINASPEVYASPDLTASSHNRITASPEVPHNRITPLPFTIVCLLMIASGLYLNLHKDVSVPVNKPLDLFPRAVSEWRMTGEATLSESVQKVLKATDTLSRQYGSPEGKLVNLYIGYHGGGKESGGIHSPKHCLPGSGWYEVSTRRTQLNVAGNRVNLVQAVYQKGENRELFLYWFQARNKTMNEEYSLKMAEITNSMLNGRRDTSFIRVSVPFETDEHTAVKLGESFIRDFYPAIQDFLPG